MKAVQYSHYGGPEVLIVNDQIAEPMAKQGQVVVKIYAACINPFDGILRQGFLKEKIPLALPITFGGDFAGKVHAIGEGVGGFVVGDEVYGTSLVLTGGSGSFAQMTVANEASIAKKPSKVTFEEAAALPLAGTSAIQAIEDHIHLSAGQKILIHGAAGGIGHIAVQLAKSMGAYVIATTGTDDIDFVRSLGTDVVIDYKTQTFDTVVGDIDAVFDTVGGETTKKSFAVLKKGGVLVSMAGQPDEAVAAKYEVTAIGQGTKVDTDHLSRLAAYVDSGKVKVHIGGSFAMADVVAASKLAEGHVRGKVVVTV